MKRLINHIIALFKELFYGTEIQKGITITNKIQEAPKEKSKEYKEIEKFLRRKQLKAFKNSCKRYATTKGF